MDQPHTDNFKGSRNKKSKKKKRELIDREPPFSLEAEIGVLGSMMLMPETCDDIVNLLKPDDFHDEAHRVLFDNIMEMHSTCLLYTSPSPRD